MTFAIEDDDEKDPPWAKYLHRRAIQTIAEEERDDYTAVATGGRSASRSRSVSTKSSAKSRASQPKAIEAPQYLTYDSIMGGGKIIVCKIPNSLHYYGPCLTILTMIILSRARGVGSP